jgi:hypothetical protein
MVAPADMMAMSIPVKSAVAVSSTTMSRPSNGSTVPADFAELKNRTSSTGTSRCSSSARMTRPT